MQMTTRLLDQNHYSVSSKDITMLNTISCRTLASSALHGYRQLHKEAEVSPKSFISQRWCVARDIAQCESACFACMLDLGTHKLDRCDKGVHDRMTYL